MTKPISTLSISMAALGLTALAMPQMAYAVTGDGAGLSELTSEIETAIATLDADKTEVEVYETVCPIVQDAEWENDIVTGALTNVVQTSQISGDQVTVGGLTKIIKDDCAEYTEMTDGSGGVDGSGLRNGRIGAPPNALTGGGTSGSSDY